MSIEAPILVTGAAGRVGGVGREVVEILRQRGLPVRALVRSEDDRAESLRATGAEVVVGALTRPEAVARALEGCRRMSFGMSVSAPYLEATVAVAAVTRANTRAKRMKSLRIIVPHFHCCVCAMRPGSDL